MKKTFKTIVYGFMTMVLFGSSAQAVLAATVFNNHQNDYQTILVSNYTDNPGSNSNWSTSVSADAGDIVSVLVYYHNNGSEPAYSTKLKINNSQTLGSAYTHQFSGSVSAANASQVSDSATVNLSSSQSLTYISGSASWYANNQSSTEYTLPNGQNGTEVFTSSGVNIGTIAPGWASQGSFVVQYQVSGSQQNQAPIVTTNSYSLNGNQATLNGYVNGQGQNPNTYFVYGTSSNLGSGSQTTSQDYQSSTSTNFSETVNVNSNTTYYYKACATTNGGTVCGSTLSFSTNNNDNDNDVFIPNVVTNNATNVDEDSATLNGEVESTGNSTVSFLKFVYGTNQNNLFNTVYASPSSTNSNGTDFDYNLSGLNDDTTYYYKACGTNSVGEDCGSIKSFTTDSEDDNDNGNDIEVNTLSATNVDEDSATLRGDIIETNGEDVERYFEYGEDDDDLDETTYLSGETDNEGTFSKTISGLDEDTTYYFRACIESQDSNDDDCGSVRSFRTDDDNNYDDYDNDGDLISNTTFATGITGSSAVLNGVSINETNASSASYFEYGTSTGNLGLGTSSNTVSAGQTLYNSKTVTGLLANTTYYYRIVTGDVKGQIKSFRTGSNVSTVVITNTTSTTTNTNTATTTKVDNGGGEGIIYLALDITPDFENVYEGDTINFDVDYRNLYNGDLEDVIIHVRFPEEIEFRKATQGFYSDLDRTLTVDLGDLEDDEEGTILIQTDVLGRLNNQDIAVTTAEGTYDHPTIENAQGSSLAHALNTILEDRATLGAFALGAGIFPGVFGWLILILLVLVIVWISRKIYNDHNDRKNQKPTFQIN